MQPWQDHVGARLVRRTDAGAKVRYAPRLSASFRQARVRPWRESYIHVIAHGTIFGRIVVYKTRRETRRRNGDREAV